MSAGEPRRPASTLILVRDAANGPETLMLQRTHKAKFVAGAYVFPGGALDPEDASERVARRVRGMDDAAASARLGLDSGGLAWWIAAIRECFEESGILLATDEHGVQVSAERVATLGDFRAPLNAGEVSFAEFLEGADLHLPLDALAYFAHWITPPGRPRRFDTRFFIARAPHGQDGAHDNQETIHSVWTRPQDAIERAKRGEIELVFATRNTLAEVGRFDTVAALLDDVRARPGIETNAACWAYNQAGERSLYRRADAPYFEIHWSDPDETGETSVAMTPGVPKRLDALVTRIIAPNPGMMTGPGTNAYLVGRNELALIDPGPEIDSHIEAILAAGAGRIRWILCTHTHIDHSPAAVAIRNATGAQVIGMPAPPGASQDATFAPERIPKHGERLQLAGVTFRAIHTPGHASNHLCYLLEETRMLFTGDHVMQGSTVVIGPPDGDMRAYLASLEMLLEEDVAILAPGHGYLIGDPDKEVRRLVRHRLGREAKVKAAMAKVGDATIEELVPVVYDDVSPALHRVASRSLAAHLGKLVADGTAREVSGRYSLID